MHWWELYYKKAVALVNDNRSVWKAFIEAKKVLKLSFKTLRPGSNVEVFMCRSNIIAI